MHGAQAFFSRAVGIIKQNNAKKGTIRKKLLLTIITMKSIVKMKGIIILDINEVLVFCFNYLCAL